MIEPKYIQQVKKGDVVQYMQKPHTVQEYKGMLFIQFINKEGERKRLYMKKHPDYLFEYGTYQDWLFNGWWKLYPEYELFKQYAEIEKMDA